MALIYFILEMYSEDQVMSVDESRVYAPPNKLQVRIQTSILRLIKLSTFIGQIQSLQNKLISPSRILV